VIVKSVAQILVFATLLCALRAHAQTLIDDLPPPDHADSFVEGIALGLYFEDEGRTYASYLWEIAATGADTVSLIITLTQESVESVEVERDVLLTPSDDDVRAAIRSAHALGLEVLLFPIINVERRAMGEWRGTLRPADVDRWFDSYSTLIAQYAALAQEEGAAVLCVGSELGSMEEHEARWRALIADVRATYSGRLIYSANWDHYMYTPFWDALDLVGVTGYHELAPSGGYNPDIASLSDAWVPFVDFLEALSARVGAPVILSEVGYVSQTGAAWHPWDYTATGAPDAQAQLDLYRALFLAWEDEEWLGGIFVWNWFGDGGLADNGYTPRNKPAEQVIRHWFGAEASQ
jgi:hypothetical protein